MACIRTFEEGCGEKATRSTSACRAGQPRRLTLQIETDGDVDVNIQALGRLAGGCGVGGGGSGVRQVVSVSIVAELPRRLTLRPERPGERACPETLYLDDDSDDVHGCYIDAGATDRNQLMLERRERASEKVVQGTLVDMGRAEGTLLDRRRAEHVQPILQKIRAGYGLCPPLTASASEPVQQKQLHRVIMSL